MDLIHSPVDPLALKELLRAQALSLGFELFGVADALPHERSARLEEWLRAGMHAGMGWMERDTERRRDPRLVLDGARSVILVGLNYKMPRPARRGEVSTYALGGDYHKLVVGRLKHLCETLRAHGGENRPYADTGPLMEKPLAELAGLGWQGRHTCVVNERMGAFFFLGCIVTTLALPPDAPAANRCGKCRRCLGACPTGALGEGGALDSRLCLSYLTIEHRGAIPEELRPLMGGRLFGCDSCLAACPWNRAAPDSREARFAPRPLADPAQIVLWTSVQFEQATSGSAIKRAGLQGLRRNACIVLGNTGTQADLDALRKAACGDDPIVAEHALWACRRIRARLGLPPEDDATPADAVPLPIDGILDLHTFRPSEVPDLLDEYMRECASRGILSLRVIHGKGTGALRDMVHARLSRSGLVESFALAQDGGGWGATIVRLRR